MDKGQKKGMERERAFILSKYDTVKHQFFACINFSQISRIFKKPKLYTRTQRQIGKARKIDVAKYFEQQNAKNRCTRKIDDLQYS